MPSLQETLITKASGELVPFSEEKLKNSLRNAGADESMIDTIISEIEPHLYKGISTKKIYKYAFNILRDRSRFLAARYHLKRGIMELGPSGFPFERFVAEVLKEQGYEVQTGQFVEGKCVKHEIDVIAQKDEHHFMVECKYHNRPGLICDVKIPLYIQARFKDVESAWKLIPGHGEKFHQGWVVTNTRFTLDAIQYGNCAGLYLLGWNHPVKKGLKDLIDDLRLYPVTCLTSITKKEKELLLEHKMVLSREICKSENLLQQLGFKSSRIRIIMDEANRLCNHQETKKGTH